MYKSKLIELYQTLSREEIRGLKQWVHSPAHNRHEDVQKLFEFLFSRSTISSVTVQKKRAFTYLYPDKPYKNLRLRHVMSFALEVLEEFVSYHQLTKDDFFAKISLATTYRQRNLPKHARQALKSARQQLDQQTVHNNEYYLNRYRAELERFDQEGTHQRIRAINLQEITSQFSTFFIINTLKYACLGASYRNIQKSEYRIPMLEAVLGEIAEHEHYQNIPAVMIYYYSYLALTQPDEVLHFQKLKSYLLQYDLKLSLVERRETLLVALNYCIRRLNTGSETYIKEAFELYKFGLEGQILIEQGLLSHFAYKNIVALGLGLQEFDWVERFIPQYAPLLAPQYRDNYVHYNTARLHFKRGDYGKAMRLLVQVEYDDLLMTTDAKIMLLKIYYEEGEQDSLSSLLSSFAVFLQRKKLMSYHKENYKNIIQFTKRLLQLKPFDKPAKKLLQQNIQSTSPLTEKAWLLEQLGKV